MPGTKLGGKKSSLLIKQKHGDDFFKKIGAKGGANGNTGGFFGDSERAKLAGAKGGAMSKRRNAVSDEVFIVAWYKYKTTKEIGAAVGMKAESVTSRAGRMRKRGVDLAFKRNKRKS